MTDVAPVDPAAALYAKVRRRGDTRRQSLVQADLALTDAVRLVREALRDGVELNLTEVARCAGVTKQTVYDRLGAEIIAARRSQDRPDDPTPEDPTHA